MTEQEWLASSDTEQRVEFLRGRISDRKMRLFGCACCRLQWSRLREEFKNTVGIAELYADSPTSGKRLRKCHKVISEWSRAELGVQNGLDAIYLQELGTCVTGADAINAVFCAVAYWKDTNELNQKWAMLHDVIGPLAFRQIRVKKEWLTGNARQLADSIYDDRAFDRLPILADALEEAGCTNADILAHCRGAGPHVRGCWVLDLLLGRE